jgi:hypothetical protein
MSGQLIILYFKYMDSKSKMKNVGLQTDVPTKEYIPPSVAVQHNLESEEYPKFIASPHNIIALGVTCSVLLYLTLTSNGTFEDIRICFLRINISSRFNAKKTSSYFLENNPIICYPLSNFHYFYFIPK